MFPNPRSLRVSGFFLRVSASNITLFASRRRNYGRTVFVGALGWEHWDENLGREALGDGPLGWQRWDGSIEIGAKA